MTRKHRSPRTRQTAQRGDIDRLMIDGTNLDRGRADYLIVAEDLSRTSEGKGKSKGATVLNPCPGLTIAKGSTGQFDPYKNVTGLKKLFIGPTLEIKPRGSKLESMGVDIIETDSAHSNIDSIKGSLCGGDSGSQTPQQGGGGDTDPITGLPPDDQPMPTPTPDDGIGTLPIVAGAGLLGVGVIALSRR